MGDKKAAYSIRSKIWIEDKDGAVAFGLGRYRILAAVDRLGSMQAAAKDLKMSYRAVWCRLKASGDRLGQPLVERKGKGSQLTPYARTLMKQFRRLHAIIEAESDEVYASLMQEHIH